MIYTVTFNPSLDYYVSVKDFELGKTNRTVTEQILPGGKGINVSTVLKNLGIENTALGFTAGFTGEEFSVRIRELGFTGDFIHLSSGLTRINIKMKDFEGTEINGKGPAIDEDALKKLYKQLDKLAKGDILILAGSIPETMSDSAYRDIVMRLAAKGVVFVVDATKDLLLKVLEYHPFLIKPNHYELGEIFGITLQDPASVILYAKKLQEAGARNVLVSMAGMGAVLAAENHKIYQLPAPQGEVINAVGAGDSMVAGFVAGWLQEKDYMHALRMGVAAGSASAFSEFLATKEEIMKWYERML